MRSINLYPETTNYYDSDGICYEFNCYDGGRYGDLTKWDEWGGWLEECGCEVHHMPCAVAACDDNSPYKMDYDDVPAIVMFEEDHRETASWGSNGNYQARQSSLMKQGRIRDAFAMDVADIQSKFGNKYDAQIQGALDYLNSITDSRGILII